MYSFFNSYNLLSYVCGVFKGTFFSAIKFYFFPAKIRRAPSLLFIYNITYSRKQGSINTYADGINLSNLGTCVPNYTASHEDDYEVNVVKKPEITNTEKEMVDLPYEESFIRCLLASKRIYRRNFYKEWENINPLSPELNPICYLLALLWAHYFLHVSRIKVKSLTLRRLMSYIYIYMEHPFLMFVDHTQRHSTVGRTPLDEWSARRRDLYLKTHDTHNRQISMPPVGFEPKISAGERQGPTECAASLCVI